MIVATNPMSGMSYIFANFITRACFINRNRGIGESPRGLKPAFLLVLDGAAKAAPLQRTIYETGSNDFLDFGVSDFPVSMGKQFCYAQLAQFVRCVFPSVVGIT